MVVDLCVVLLVFFDGAVDSLEFFARGETSKASRLY
jgi:hypothetical protein